MNAPDIIILSILAIVAILAAWFVFRKKGSSCHGGCSGCKYNSSCGEADSKPAKK